MNKKEELGFFGDLYCNHKPAIIIGLIAAIFTFFICGWLWPHEGRVRVPWIIAGLYIIGGATLVKIVISLAVGFFATFCWADRTDNKNN